MRHALRVVAALSGAGIAAAAITVPSEAPAAINTFAHRPYHGPMRPAPGNAARCPAVRPVYGAACAAPQLNLVCQYVPTGPRAPAQIRAVFTCSNRGPGGRPWWRAGAVASGPSPDRRRMMIEGPLPPPESAA